MKKAVDYLGKNIKGYGKLISVGFSGGERECWFNDKGVLCRYPTQLVEQDLNKEVDKDLLKYFNSF